MFYVGSVNNSLLLDPAVDEVLSLALRPNTSPLGAVLLCRENKLLAGFLSPCFYAHFELLSQKRGDGNARFFFF